jgi:hypothetical protein
LWKGKQELLTQYIKAQYQASTKNGNFCNNRLKKYPSNRRVLGDTTSRLNPNTRISRFLQWGSCSGSSGEEALYPSSSEALDRGLERPDPDDAGDDDRGECEALRRRSKMRYSVLRLTHVPPKRRVTTTSGSMKAPTPMVEVEEVRGSKREGWRRRMLWRPSEVCAAVRWEQLGRE